jgi:hydroxymethylpyrimidine/phosphomethylpyrimidine kinase
MERAAHAISEATGTAVLVKGGHLRFSDGTPQIFQDGPSADVLCRDDLPGKSRFFGTEWVKNPNTHGTGCTLSSSIACHLAAGMSLEESITEAKGYLTEALAAMLDLGHGSGPLNHTCRL